MTDTACIFCRKTISYDAKICPYCHSKDAGQLSWKAERDYEEYLSKKRREEDEKKSWAEHEYWKDRPRPNPVRGFLIALALIIFLFFIFSVGKTQ